MTTISTAHRYFAIRDESSHTLRWVVPRLGLAFFLCVIQLLRVGFHPDRPLVSAPSFTVLEIAALTGLASIYGFAFVRRSDRFAWLKRHWREPIILLVGIIALAAGWHRPYIAAIAILTVLLFTRVYVIFTDRLSRPGLLFVSSFVILILSGGFMLKLPAATPIDNPISWIDAFFTSTSAVCVTGLIVRDTATQFTPLGQTIILVLIQLGGLGIILFGSLFAVMFGGSISLRQATSIGEVVESSDTGLGNVDRLVRFVVVATLLTEAIGALLIYAFSPATIPSGAIENRDFFNSVFLSISAFCNAGFAPFTESLVDYQSRFTVQLLIPILIVVGGLGFPVLFNLSEVMIARFRLRFKLATPQTINRKHIVCLNLHTKIVIATTALLYLIGTVGLFIGQWSFDRYRTQPHVAQTNSLLTTGDHDSDAIDTSPAVAIGHHLVNASFMSVSARTAGFNSIGMNELAPSSRYLLIILMFIGGSPGSAAGGIKTIVFAVLVLSIWSTIRGRAETEAFGRSIPFELVRRAGVAASLGLFAVAATTLGLTLTEAPGSEFDLFEAASACGTVGLSMGVTGGLSAAGKLVIVAGMFLGRIGPLALIGVIAFGATAASRHARYRYPQEPIVMG